MGRLQHFHHTLLLCATTLLTGTGAFAQGIIDFDPARLLGGFEAASRFYQRFSFSALPFNHRWQDDLYTSNTPRTRYTLRLERGWQPHDGALRFNAGLAWQPPAAKGTYSDHYHLSLAPDADLLSDLSNPGLTPYLGLHWVPDARHRLDLNLDLGIRRSTGSGEARLDARDNAKRTPPSLDLLGLTPIMSIGLSYSF